VSVALAVRDPLGRYFAALTTFKKRERPATGPALLAQLLKRFKFDELSQSLPRDLSQQDIEGVHDGLEKGMSQQAVKCSIGNPDRTWNWALGGQQWLYFDGRHIIYFDSKGRVDYEQQAVN
jgi:hypothetical protein